MKGDLKIVSGVDRVDELDALVDAGADELYCGIWRRDEISHGNQALNRRDGSAFSLQGLEEMEALLDRARQRDVPVYLALNAFYSDHSLDLALEQFRDASALRPAGVIVADVALLRAIRDSGYDGKVIVSVGGTAFNREAVRFYAEMGAGRVILPRHIHPKEFSNFRDEAIELEILVLEDRCVFVDGLCNWHHSLPGRGPVNWNAHPNLAKKVLPVVVQYLNRERTRRAIDAVAGRHGNSLRRACAYRYAVTPMDPGGNDIAADELSEKLSDLLAGHTHVETCGLCELRNLASAGIGFMKIANRGKGTSHKTRSIRMARRAIDAAGGGTDDAGFVEFAKTNFREAHGFACDDSNCYFPRG